MVMDMKTIHRSISGVRRSPRISASRISAANNSSSFTALLSKLGLASQRLHRSRPRSR
jgi:hypothetical protein